MDKKNNSVSIILFFNLKFYFISKVKINSYCQIVSDENAIKRKHYAYFCIMTQELFLNCIFIDETIIEMVVHSRTSWRKKGCNYKVGKPKHAIKVTIA
jgi:hypothetical protein